jgi:MauM/NapG family ferredoxin protein
VVRPPGAVPEAEFLALCTRCTKCLDACPEQSLVRAPPTFGPELELLPILVPEQRACYLCTDVPCAAACPTGALLPIQASEIDLGLAVVSPRLCLNSLGHPCDACLTACPFPGRAIVAGSGGVPAVDDSVCNGCGQCVLACRSMPKALRIEPT